jgi:hypothetical protein
VDSGVFGILGFVLIFVVLAVVALRFGHDSRAWVREMPFGSDVAFIMLRPPRSWGSGSVKRWSRCPAGTWDS